MANSFFYDGQIRRFLYQFIRVMSNFQVEYGRDRNGIIALQTVPVFYGDSTRQVANILAGNTENATPAVPAMAVYISSFAYDRTRVQNPTHVSKLNIRERSYDHATQEWGHGQGNAFTVERAMPAPYKLTLNVDIWTSNTEQKLQLIEQMTPLFNPAMEIQSTDNYIDWTSLSAIWLTNTNWSGRTVPMGANGTIDVATLTFELPIWLSLPAKVKKLGVVERIISTIFDPNGDLSNELIDLPTSAILAQVVVTPMQFSVGYIGNALQLFRAEEPSINRNSKVYDDITGKSYIGGNVAQPGGLQVYSWQVMATMYGATLANGISTVRLDQPNGATVVGTVSMHPTDPSLLLFSPFADTIPANTLPPVDSIIDPFQANADTAFLNVLAGTRYIVLHSMGSLDNEDEPIAWAGGVGQPLVAAKNDIIEFDGVHWVVAFNAASEASVKYLTNMKTGAQVKWDPDTKTWNRATEGTYTPGEWTIVLN